MTSVRPCLGGDQLQPQSTVTKESSVWDGQRRKPESAVFSTRLLKRAFLASLFYQHTSQELPGDKRLKFRLELTLSVHPSSGHCITMHVMCVLLSARLTQLSAKN